MKKTTTLALITVLAVSGKPARLQAEPVSTGENPAVIHETMTPEQAAAPQSLPHEMLVQLAASEPSPHETSAKEFYDRYFDADVSDLIDPEELKVHANRLAAGISRTKVQREVRSSLAGRERIVDKIYSDLGLAQRPKAEIAAKVLALHADGTDAIRAQVFSENQAALRTKIRDSYQRAVAGAGAAVPEERLQAHLSQLEQGMLWSKVNKQIQDDMNAKEAAVKKVYTDLGLTAPRGEGLALKALSLYTGSSGSVRQQAIDENKDALKKNIRNAYKKALDGTVFPVSEGSVESRFASLSGGTSWAAVKKAIADEAAGLKEFLDSLAQPMVGVDVAIQAGLDAFMSVFPTAKRGSGAMAGFVSTPGGWFYMGQFFDVPDSAYGTPGSLPDYPAGTAHHLYDYNAQAQGPFPPGRSSKALPANDPLRMYYASTYNRIGQGFFHPEPETPMLVKARFPDLDLPKGPPMPAVIGPLFDVESMTRLDFAYEMRLFAQSRQYEQALAAVKASGESTSSLAGYHREMIDRAKSVSAYLHDQAWGWQQYLNNVQGGGSFYGQLVTGSGLDDKTKAFVDYLKSAAASVDAYIMYTDQAAAKYIAPTAAELRLTQEQMSKKAEMHDIKAWWKKGGFPANRDPGPRVGAPRLSPPRSPATANPSRSGYSINGNERDGYTISGSGFVGSQSSYSVTGGGQFSLASPTRNASATARTPIRRPLGTIGENRIP